MARYRARSPDESRSLTCLASPADVAHDHPPSSKTEGSTVGERGDIGLLDSEKPVTTRAMVLAWDNLNTDIKRHHAADDRRTRAAALARLRPLPRPRAGTIPHPTRRVPPALAGIGLSGRGRQSGLIAGFHGCCQPSRRLTQVEGVSLHRRRDSANLRMMPVGNRRQSFG